MISIVHTWANKHVCVSWSDRDTSGVVLCVPVFKTACAYRALAATMTCDGFRSQQPLDTYNAGDARDADWYVKDRIPGPIKEAFDYGGFSDEMGTCDASSMGAEALLIRALHEHVALQKAERAATPVPIDQPQLSWLHQRPMPNWIPQQ